MVEAAGSPLVSVLIPTKDRVVYLRETLASVLSQSYRNLEVLVSDDGSADGTLSYLRALAEREPRVAVLTGNPRPGVFGNFAYLLENANGDYVCFLGDDDLLYEGFTAALLRGLARTPGAVGAFCDYDVIDAGGALLPEDTAAESARSGRAELPAGQVADPDLVILRQAASFGFLLVDRLHARAVGLRQDLGGAGDLAFLAGCIQRGPLYFEPQRLGAYRRHEKTATRVGGRYMVDGLVAVLNDYAATTPQGEVLRRRRLKGALVMQLKEAAREDLRSAVPLSYQALVARRLTPAEVTIAWIRTIGWRLLRSIGTRTGLDPFAVPGLLNLRRLAASGPTSATGTGTEPRKRSRCRRLRR